MDGLRMLTHGEPAEKLRFLFNVYDVDGGSKFKVDTFFKSSAIIIIPVFWHIKDVFIYQWLINLFMF